MKHKLEQSNNFSWFKCGATEGLQSGTTSETDWYKVTCRNCLMLSSDFGPQARWLLNNMTVANRRLIVDAQSLPECSRKIVLTANLKTIIKDRVSALNRAIDQGDCESNKYATFDTEAKMAPIIAIMVPIVMRLTY